MPRLVRVIEAGTLLVVIYALVQCSRYFAV